MSFYRTKRSFIPYTALIITLLIAAYFGTRLMTSVYNKDLGNGVIIYADDYVKSGHWVFDCNYSRLINRTPLPAPTDELEKSGKLTIDNMYTLPATEQAVAKAVIRAATAQPGWYKKLRYVYSGLSEYSDIRAHLFDLLTQHEGRTWGLRVRQNIQPNGSSNFEIAAEPYDPKTYIDYGKAFESAAKSCPAPQ